MACSTRIITKDFFMKTENNNSSDDQEPCKDQKNKNNAIFSSGFENIASTPSDQQIGDISLKSSTNENMSQSVCLFRKYLFTRTQNNMGKTSKKAEFQSEIIKKDSSPVHPLLHLGSNNLRGHQLSLLEQALLPRLRCDDEKTNKTSTTEQLTIFYDGIMNVYDNLPADKVQAIMRLASENSSAKPLPAAKSKSDGRKPPLGPKLLPVSKLRAGLPMTRRYSLQCFLEKRRGRTINNSPYAPHSETHESNEAAINSVSIENLKLSLSPFPSRLGYFSPTSADQGSC